MQPVVGPPGRRTARRSRLSLAFSGLLLIGVLLGAFAVLPTASAQPNGPNPPLGAHLSYLDDPTTAVITWHTTSLATSRVEWGTSPGPPYPFAATGTNYLSPGGTFLHTVTLTGLAPGTRYYYRIGDTSMESWLGEETFRAAPGEGSGATFTFAAAGDWGNTSNAAATANGIAAAAPNLVLGVGDYYYSDSEAYVRDFYEKWQVFGTNAFVQMGMGNHEVGLPGEPEHTPKEVHCAFVNLPGNERSYSFKYGNTFFLTLDWGRFEDDTTGGVDGTGISCGGNAGTAAIRAWTDAQLAAADVDPDVTWKVVIQHFPCYDPTDSGLRVLCPHKGTPDRIEDILTNRGVDLVLQAHLHTYGRTHPVEFGSALQQGSSYSSPGAPVYVLLGTGGHEPLNTGGCGTDAWVAACRPPRATSGYGHFTVTPTTITYRLVENTEGVLDSFSLSRGAGESTTLSFQKGDGGAYSETDDTFLFAGSPNTTYGGNNTLQVDGGGCIDLSQVPTEVCRALIKFPDFLGPNSGQVPRGSTILDAILEVSVTTPAMAHDVYQVTEAWTESAATWNSFATPGFPANKGIVFSYNPDRIGRFSLNVTSIVRNWSNGDANHGIFIASTNDDGGWYASSESNLSEKLRVTFEAAGGPPPAFDFTLATNPASGSVAPGESDSSSVTATLTSGTPNSVSFSASGLPSGATASFSPTGCMPTCTSTMTVSTSTSTPLGTYTITVSGSDGSITRTTVYTLVVETAPPAFDFTLSTDPTSGTVSPGDSTSTSVTATLTAGTPNSVSFNATGLPSGGSASFSPTGCVPTCSNTMTIGTSSNTPAGTFTVTVRATDGTITRTATYRLVVEAPPPAFDFTLSTNPTSGQVAPEESTTTSVTATLTSGTPNSVSFGATGLPSGASASLSPTGCVPTCTSTMTVSTSTSTPPGTYTITVSGSDGSITRTTAYTLVIEALPPEFDFSLSVSPSSGTVNPGGSLSTSVKATLTSGSPNSVSFSTSGLPSGASASFSPTGCVPTCTSTMTLRTSTNTPVGTYSVTLKASDGSITRTTGFSLTVEAPPPPPDFSITVSPDYLNLDLGDSGTCGITLRSLNGFSGTVSLSVSVYAIDVPPLIPVVYPSASVSPSSVTLSSGGTGSSTLTVSTSLLTTPGRYGVTVTATSGSITHSVTVIVDVSVL